MVKALTDQDFEKLGVPIGLVQHIKPYIAAGSSGGAAKQDATMKWKTDNKGRFTRHESVFRNVISD